MMPRPAMIGRGWRFSLLLLAVLLLRRLLVRLIRRRLRMSAMPAMLGRDRTGGECEQQSDRARHAAVSGAATLTI